jgi:DNA mismatch repair protein MutS
VQRKDELIDLPQTTRRNLELTQTLRGEEKPTLFSLLDTCMTGMGSRLLKSWLLAPRRERSEAQQRHSAIAALHSATTHGEPAVAPPARAAQGQHRCGAHHRPHGAAPGAPA